MRLPPWAFGRHAPRLAACGYEAIPITLPCAADPSAGKKPAMAAWQQGCPRERWPEFTGCATGLLTRYLPTVDLDTLDVAIGDAIQGLVDRHLGDAPVRYGQAPKRAMPFRLTGAPFGKLQLSWKAIAGTGDEGRPKNPGVEILSRNQQFVALGIHPGTRRPYRWERDPDLSIPRPLLPPLDEATARHFMAVVARFITDIGGQLTSGGSLLDQPRPRAARRKPVLRGVSSASEKTSDAVRIAAALERMGNADVHYDEWIRIGLALKAALDEAGWTLFDHWSRLSSKYDPIITERKWRSFQPHSIGAGSIFWAEHTP